MCAAPQIGYSCFDDDTVLRIPSVDRLVSACIGSRLVLSVDLGSDGEQQAKQRAPALPGGKVQRRGLVHLAPLAGVRAGGAQEACALNAGGSVDDGHVDHVQR